MNIYTYNKNNKYDDPGNEIEDKEIALVDYNDKTISNDILNEIQGNVH